MKTSIIILSLMFAVIVYGNCQTSSHSSHEKIIKDYFAGWTNKNWNAVSSTLADGFTFTSAAPDDHIPIDKFKEKCWVQAYHIERFEFTRIVSNANEAFAIVHVITKNNKIIRNVEYFHFENGKIKSIEVFFGGN